MNARMLAGIPESSLRPDSPSCADTSATAVIFSTLCFGGGKEVEAVKCYERAYACGDTEGIALPRLAKLHEHLGNRTQAATYYNEILNAADEGSQV